MSWCKVPTEWRVHERATLASTADGAVDPAGRLRDRDPSALLLDGVRIPKAWQRALRDPGAALAAESDARQLYHGVQARISHLFRELDRDRAIDRHHHSLARVVSRIQLYSGADAVDIPADGTRDR